jgi:putative hydrolase of the HAD superfamily
VSTTHTFTAAEAVLLDAGGVFVVPHPELLAAALRPFGGGQDHDELVATHYSAMAAADSLTGFDWATYQQTLLLGCGIDPGAHDECTAAMIASAAATPWWSYPLPGAVDGLRALARKVPVGIVSNADGTVARLLADLAICQIGDGSGVPVRCVVDSAVVGVAKPDPGIFTTALEVLDLPADRIAYVGDTLAYDVAGARAAGLHPVHLDPYRLCALPTDHDHIAALGELLAFLA